MGKSSVKLLLPRQLFFILLIQLTKLLFIALLEFCKLLVLVLNLLFFLFDQLLLPLDGILHALSFLVLLIFVSLHVSLEILLDFLDVVNFGFLLLEQISRLLKLRVLISQLVDFSLELVRLLLFDHLNVTLGNFLDLSEAAVREAISLEANVHQGRVLVQGFKHDSLDLLRKEVICQLDGTDFLVSFQSIDQVNQTSVIKPT